MKSGLSSRERVIYGGLSPVFGRNIVRQAEIIRSRAEWSPDQLERFRVERFQETLRHAASTVPYYTQLFAKTGFVAGDFQSFEQIEKIPPLTRPVLRQRFSDLRSSAVPDDAVVRRSTGGTTGAPVTVALDRAGEVERMLVNHRMYALMNRALGMPTLMIAGSPIDSVAWMTLRDRVKNLLFGVDIVSSFNLTGVTIDETVERLASGKYPWVIAYASVFDILASHVSGTGRRLRIPKIVPCAELVSQAQRLRWRETFECEIFEIYGSREMTSIAGELQDHRNMAVSSDLYHVEILDESGDLVPSGQPGLITISTLAERGMPLIRYQLGDIGVLEPPPSDSPVPFPRLRITHGRLLDVICCPNGKMLPGEYFPHLMKEVEQSVDAFQVLQTELTRLLVRLVPRGACDPSVTEYLRRHIQSQVGDEVTIVFELVDSIEFSPSGKYRPTISLLPPSEKRFLF